MEIRQLEYLIEIAQTGSFTRAARKLYVSQPSLSKAIRRLEAELGQTLLERGKQTIILTDAGHRLLESAERIVGEHNSVLAELMGASATYRGRLTVGIPPLICSCFFAPIIAGFRQAYPEIAIEIVERGAKAIQDDVEAGHLDVGIVILPVYEGRFEVTPLVSDETVLVVSDKNPLSRLEQVCYTDLKQETLVIFNDEYILHHQIIADCRKAGFEPRIWAVSGQWDYLIELAALELGVTILPRPTFRKGIREGVRAIPFRREQPDWHVVAIVKQNRKRLSLARQFVAYSSRNIIA